MFFNNIFNYLNISNSKIIIGSIISLLIFTINLETDPRLGNIWYRVNTKGIKVVNFKNILGFFTKPFSNRFFWTREYITINPYIFCPIFILILHYYDIYITQILKYDTQPDTNYSELLSVT